MGLLVGVDGGGTRTRCGISDGNTILGRGLAAGCNIVRLGETRARESIQSAIREAFRAADIQPDSATAACIGVAGSSVAQVRAAVLSIVEELLPCTVTVVGDQEIAYEAAFGDGHGILVIGGTGSIAFGRSADGRTANAGGHGFIISDEGSGQWIGRTAVSNCLRAVDAGTRCELMPLLLESFDVRTVGELINAANAVPLPNFSGLMPVIMEASQRGDAIAIDVLKKAGCELAALAKLVVEKLGIDHQDIRVAVAGGVFEHSTLVREAFEYSLTTSYPHSTVLKAVAEPLLGALAIARKTESSREPQLR